MKKTLICGGEGKKDRYEKDEKGPSSTGRQKVGRDLELPAAGLKERESMYQTTPTIDNWRDIYETQGRKGSGSANL